MILSIKGMVCNRCVYVLEQELTKLGFEVLEIKLGEVTIKNTAHFSQKQEALRMMLTKNGFELLYDRNQRATAEIKELVEQGITLQLETGTPTRFPALISNALHRNYDTLSALFSSAEGITLEKYIIHRKIEKVKELLVYTEMSLTEIASVLGYSSQAYLSNQLKKQTGFTSGHYKRIKQDKEEIMLAHAKEAGFPGAKQP